MDDKGTFTFTKDGGKVVLNSENGIDRFIVGENKLILLDKGEKEARSEPAERYQLTKLSSTNVEFSTKPVRGLLIFGHEVHTFEPSGSSEIYWIYDFKDGKLAKLYNEK